MMRRAWPTMMLTLFALLTVVGVLLVTGSGAETHRFALSASPTTMSVARGGTVRVQIEVTASRNFHGAVTLSSSLTPDGIQARFDASRVQLTRSRPIATAVLTVTIGDQAPDGTVEVSVLATDGRASATGNLSLQINSLSITDAGAPPVTGSGSG
ncbi:MAG TPA: hypothetical protein VJ851_06390 [Jatrophihabitans sp.]|nr:hypothetical protein [Jatrophihabitans sp.]